MIRNMNKRQKFIFFAVIIISLIIIYIPYIFMGRKYLNTFDTANLHIAFYTEFRNKIYSGESLLWSHNFLFGSSFLTGKSFYLTTDIFSYVFLLFPFLDVVDALFVIQLIKNIVSYIGIYQFLNEFEFSFKSKIVGALVYTFSGWFFLFYGMPTFASFAAILPFFFSAIEQYLKNNKIIVVVFMTVIIICTNFYFFYTLSIFLIFYWIARYLLFIGNKFNFVDFVKKTIFLILIYILGIGITTPIFIPTVYGMMQNSRLSGTGTTNILWSIKIYADMFIKFISSPVYVSKNVNTVLQSNYYRFDQIGLFTSSCACLLLPQYFIVSNKRNKVIVGLFIVLMLFFLFTQFGCSMFHGFAEPSFRWTLFITFVICVLFTYLLNKIDFINYKLLLITGLFYCVIIILLIVYFKMFSTAKIQFFVLSLSLFLFIIYSICIYKKNNLLYMFIIFEVIILGFMSNYLWKDNYQKSYSYEFIPDNYFKKFDDNEEFYRIWVSEYNVDMDYQKDFNYNSNLQLGYKGFYSYDSEYESSLTNLIKSYGNFFQWYGFSGDGIITATSGKYYIAKNEDELPNANIEFVEKIGDSEYNLYLNKDYRLFGYTNNNIYPFEKWDYEDIAIKDQYIKDYLVISENDINDYNLNNLSNCESHHLENLTYTNTTFDGDIETTTDELLFFSIPYNEGWKIYCDGELLNIIKADSGFMSVLVPKGMHHMHLEYFPYGMSIGFIIMTISSLLLVFICIKKRKEIKL